MGAALPWIMGISTAAQVNQMVNPNLNGHNATMQANQEREQQQANVLTFDQAQQQASQQLNPIFDEHLEKTMQGIDRGNINRGFYGQLPGDAMRNDRALDVQRARTQQIGGMANSMVGQSQENSLRQQAMTMQNLQQQLAQSRAQTSQYGQMANFGAGLYSSLHGMGIDRDRLQLGKDQLRLEAGYDPYGGGGPSIPLQMGAAGNAAQAGHTGMGASFRQGSPFANLYNGR